MGYGTGAIMAVPGHDERDHAFARAMSLPIVEVDRRQHPASTCDAAFTGEGPAVNSGAFTAWPRPPSRS
jgi:leucyl-tRNA synthetase